MLGECVLWGDDGYLRLSVELVSRRVSIVFLNDWECGLPSRLGCPYTGGDNWSLNHGDAEMM